MPACGFYETITLSGTRLYEFAVLEHASRRIRVLVATAHPTASWVTRWVQTCRHELLDRTLMNQHHLLHALGEFELHYNSYRPHQGIAGARPLHALSPSITDSEQLTHLDVCRRDHMGGTLHGYRHTA